MRLACCSRHAPGRVFPSCFHATLADAPGCRRTLTRWFPESSTKSLDPSGLRATSYGCVQSSGSEGRRGEAGASRIMKLGTEKGWQTGWPPGMQGASSVHSPERFMAGRQTQATAARAWLLAWRCRPQSASLLQPAEQGQHLPTHCRRLTVAPGAAKNCQDSAILVQLLDAVIFLLCGRSAEC